MSAPVGIDKIGVYPGRLVLSMEELGTARGVDAGALRQRMLLDERSLNPTWEDPITMAVNAAETVLDDDDRSAIELLIVGTESGVDQEKSVSTWVHEHLGIGANCRNFEVKHACYGATGAVQLALSWLAAAAPAGAKALVVSTDQSRLNRNGTHEFIGGAAASAVLLSRHPRLLEMEPGAAGYWTSNVWDLARPTPTVEIVDDGLSILTYLEALEGAYAHFVKRHGTGEFEGDCRRHVYHAPFGGLALLAHKRLATIARQVPASEVRAHFDATTLPSLRYLRRIGSTYGSSTFIALLTLLATDESLAPGEPIAVFAFGSGACGEFYRVGVGPQARTIAQQAQLGALLDSRLPVTPPQYDDIEERRASLCQLGDYDIDLTEPAGVYVSQYAATRRLVFNGVSNYRRRYARS